MDVWGPASVFSTKGYIYYLVIVDDFTRYSWLFPIVLKSDVAGVVTQFVVKIERQFNTKVRVFQTDMGGEFTALKSFCSSSGIVLRHSCPHTHQQNGLVERKHQHIIELGLAILSKSGLPMSFWWCAFSTAVHLINLLPSPITHHKFPHTLLLNTPPPYADLRVFGCACFPFLRPYNNSKLQFRSTKCLFIGYSSSHRGYLCLHPSGRVYIFATVTFNEHEFPYSSLFPTSSSHSPSQAYTPTTSALPILPTPSDASENSFPNAQLSPAQSFHRASLMHTSSSSSSQSSPESISPSSVPPPLTHTHSMQTRSKSGITKPKLFSAILNSPIVEPDTVTEALSVPQWKLVMQSEYDAFIKNNTWKLVPCTDDMNQITYKWLFRVKYNKDGSMERYKARLVARGFQQTAGVEYFNTFSPVIKPLTLRIIFTIAISKKWPIQQVDINNAFLHGELNEVVYIKQPEGFVDSAHPSHVCKL